MDDIIPGLVASEDEDEISKFAGTFETQSLGEIETQVTELIQADRNIQSALLQSHLDTVSFTMIHPNGINSKIIRFLISYCFPCRVVSYQGGNQICLAPAYRIKV